MKVFGLIGWSGAGKTTLMVRLIPELTHRGLRVSTIKHTHHRFDIDHEGKDSYRHRHAGATEVMVGSGKRWALIHELRDEAEPDMDELVARMTPVDLLLVEGFKFHPHPKLEIHRPANGKPLLHPEDETVVAVASDQALPGVALPVLDLDDAAVVADFILEACELGGRAA